MTENLTLRCAASTPLAKVFRSGTDRAATPLETLDRITPLFGMAGITRVGRISGLDRIGIEVFAAYRPLSRSVSVSQGKGVTAATARVSAIMEALELWHAETHHVPLVLGSQRALARRARVVDIAHLQRYRPAPPSPDATFRWAIGTDLATGEDVHVPYEAIHVDHRVPRHPTENVFWSGSNGLASGNHAVEATVHGLCEVIERDANARSRLPDGDVVRRRLDLATVTDQWCQQLIRQITDAGLEIAVWDITTAAGVPVYEAVLLERDFPWYQPLPQAWGSGAHPTGAIALSRALTEAAQARVTLISACRDDILRSEYQRYYDVDDRAALLLELDDPEPGAIFRTGVRNDHLDADLRWLLDRLADDGFHEVVAVDLTRPEINLPVVKVVVPCMRWGL